MNHIQVWFLVEVGLWQLMTHLILAANHVKDLPLPTALCYLHLQEDRVASAACLISKSSTWGCDKTQEKRGGEGEGGTGAAALTDRDQGFQTGQNAGSLQPCCSGALG